MKKYTYRTLLFIISVAFVFVIHGLFFAPNGGPDTYTAIASPKGYLDDVFYAGGRFVHAVFFAFVTCIGKLFSINAAYHASYMINGLFAALAVYRYSLLLVEMLGIKKESSSSVAFAGFLSCITVTNIFVFEYFMYPESGPLLLIWLNIEAVNQFWRYSEDHNKKRHLIIAGILMLSGFGYQLMPGIYFVLTLPIVMIKAESIRGFLTSQITTGLHYLAGVLPSSLITKFLLRSAKAQIEPRFITQDIEKFTPEKVSSKVFILDRITSGMCMYVIVCIVIATVLTVAAVKREEYIEIIKGVYICLAVAFLAMLPFISGVTNDYKPRVYYVAGMLPGILIVYGILRKYIVLPSGGIFFVCLVSICILTVFQYLNTSEVARERYLTFYEDSYLSGIIGQRIDEYEKESGNDIDKIVFYEDSDMTKHIRNQGWCISLRAYGVEWGTLEALNYWLGRDYKGGKPDAEIAESFAGRDWSSFSDEQIVFTGDTAHICKF